jgi:4-hydroxyphenylacetate 3-monooxygenase/anthranilate 3-monooxygenase (FAD)/4-hydroxyphenylacetate 3-monooxygenase
MAPIARVVADLYDLQQTPAFEEVLSARSPDGGERVPLTLVPPASIEDLVRRRQECRVLASFTHGMLGRGPDFGNILITSFAARSDFFGDDQPWGENVRRFHRHCLARDPFVVHASINPQADRSLSSAEQADPFIHLRVVEDRPDGVLVRGAKMVATMAPIADELLVFPLPSLQRGDEPYALAFVIPIETPGLRLLCRDPALARGRNAFDYPLSTKYDEVDATCVFDDVLVPWDRIFLNGNVEMANSLFDATGARAQTGHQGVVRITCKSELMAGVAIELAEASGTSSFLHVANMLGELLSYHELLDGLLMASESRAEIAGGLATPATSPILAARCRFPGFYERMVQIIQTLGGGSLLTAPSLAAVEDHDGGDVERYFRGKGNRPTRERIALLRLAWDLVGTDFGQRQLQFERYHAGDPFRLNSSLFAGHEWADPREAVARVLGSAATEVSADGE